MEFAAVRLGVRQAVAVRWRELFDDLEGQLDAAEAAELLAEVAERTRTEQARATVADRLGAATGSALAVVVAGHGAVHGQLTDCGVDWLLIAEAGEREALVPMTAVLSVSGLGRGLVRTDPADRVARGLDLRWALRGIARDRSPVLVGLRDGSAATGTVDRVGADHLELAEHPAGEPRRPATVRGVRLVPLPALAVVRRA